MHLFSPHSCYMPAHLILLGLITQIIFGEEYSSLSSSLHSFPHSPLTPFLLDPNILLCTLFSNTLSLHSSLNVSEQVSHPHKTSNIIVLYILIFIWRGADKSLAWPTSRCRRTETIVPLERGVCSCAELQDFSCYRGRKEACQVTRAISTSRRKLSSSFFSCKARCRRKFTPFWQKH